MRTLGRLAELATELAPTLPPFTRASARILGGIAAHHAGLDAPALPSTMDALRAAERIAAVALPGCDELEHVGRRFYRALREGEPFAMRPLDGLEVRGPVAGPVANRLRAGQVDVPTLAAELNVTAKRIQAALVYLASRGFVERAAGEVHTWRAVVRVRREPESA